MVSKAGRTHGRTIEAEETQPAPAWRSWKLDWIAFVGLVLTILLLIGSGVESNTQIRDRITTVETDLKEHKTDHEARMRTQETTTGRIERKIDRILDHMGLKPTTTP